MSGIRILRRLSWAASAFGGWAVLLILAASPIAATAAVDPNGPSEFYEDALIRFNKGDFLGAIIQLKNAIQQNP